MSSLDDDMTQCYVYTLLYGGRPQLAFVVTFIYLHN